MFFTSTRQKLNVTAAQAIARGISDEGGLFVPCEIPSITIDELNKMVDMSYIDRANFVLKKYKEEGVVFVEDESDPRQMITI